MSLFQEYGSSIPSSVRSLQASGLAIDQEWSFPFAMHFALLLALRDATKNEVALFDFPRPHLLVVPPSSFLLVPAKVDCTLVF